MFLTNDSDYKTTGVAVDVMTHCNIGSQRSYCPCTHDFGPNTLPHPQTFQLARSPGNISYVRFPVQICLSSCDAELLCFDGNDGQNWYFSGGS